MKKVFFSVLMISAMFVLASCGSKSNSNEATAEDASQEETVTPKCEPADPPILYSTFDYESPNLKYENLPLEGVFEIQKIALTKVQGTIRYSPQLIGEGDCLAITINLKMINDYSQKPDIINGAVLLLNKDDAVLEEINLTDFKGVPDLYSVAKGGLGILTYTSHHELDVDGILANTKYLRIRGFSAGKRVAK